MYRNSPQNAPDTLIGGQHASPPPPTPVKRFGIDWISVTTGENVDAALCEDVMIDRWETWERVRPQNGYRYAWKSPEGVLRQNNPQRPEMGVSWVFSGGSLQALDSRGAPSLYVAETVVRHGGRFSRIDLAADAYGYSWGLTGLCKLILSGHWEGSAQKATVIESTDGGKTLYVGSRQSGRFLRCYNKAAERGFDWDWERVELELKDRAAHAITREVAQNGAGGLWGVMNGLVKGMLKVEHEGFNDFMNGEPKDLLIAKREGADTTAWLMNQVAPAIRKWIGSGVPEEWVYEFLVKAGIVDTSR